MTQVVLISVAIAALLVWFFMRTKAKGFQLMRCALYLQNLQEVIDGNPGDDDLVVTREQAEQAYQAAREDFAGMATRQGQAYCVHVTQAQLKLYGKKRVMLARARAHGFPE
ncbi:hypothetical protein SAMN05192555_102100 [Franzmannia pantelleriensis]|uniref:Uncharacterized protein n=1 Tax=Franzmannia pantelleriensis TaxID=48727 RepID=A0A1G9GCF8_9GAMM|nr:hypothetical protein [Halomonas pantelleriensis]SDK98307.1 hypothetical protein SAMN05192555_102100 [Halomonas pantelleriensis]